MRKFFGGMAFGLVSLFSAINAHGAVVVDQQSLSIYYPDKYAAWAIVATLPGEYVGTSQPISTIGAVQTITAGKEGVLDSIWFAVLASPPLSDNLKLSIVDGDYILGSRSLVGTITLPLSSLPTSTPAHPAYPFDVSAFQYHVSPGQKYSVLLESESSALFSGDALFGMGFMDMVTNQDGSVEAGNVYSTGYQGGDLAVTVDGVPFQTDYDLMFSSYIRISDAVPEPATWAMMTLGFGAIGGVLRRRKTVPSRMVSQ